jgi:cell division septation protein DedD
MTRDHTLIDELLAVRALGGLDDDDVALLERELAAHGDCEECRRLEAEHAEVAGALALALEPRPVDPAIVDRIVAEPQDATRTSPDAAGSGAAATSDELADRRLRRWQSAFGVAAAIALILAFALATRSDEVTVPSTLVRFQGDAGEVAMAYTPGESGVFLWGADLPDPGEGNVYELWLIQDGEPTSGGCLAPTDGSVAAFVDADPSSAQVMALTVESAECPGAPTTDPVFTAELA